MPNIDKAAMTIEYSHGQDGADKLLKLTKWVFEGRTVTKVDWLSNRLRMWLDDGKIVTLAVDGGGDIDMTVRLV